MYITEFLWVHLQITLENLQWPKFFKGIKIKINNKMQGTFLNN